MRASRSGVKRKAGSERGPEANLAIVPMERIVVPEPRVPAAQDYNGVQDDRLRSD
jgi:hypothetical protein